MHASSSASYFLKFHRVKTFHQSFFNLIHTIGIKQISRFTPDILYSNTGDNTIKL